MSEDNAEYGKQESVGKADELQSLANDWIVKLCSRLDEIDELMRVVHNSLTLDIAEIRTRLDEVEMRGMIKKAAGEAE